VHPGPETSLDVQSQMRPRLDFLDSISSAGPRRRLPVLGGLRVRRLSVRSQVDGVEPLQQANDKIREEVVRELLSDADPRACLKRKEDERVVELIMPSVVDPPFWRELERVGSPESWIPVHRQDTVHDLGLCGDEVSLTG